MDGTREIVFLNGRYVARGRAAISPDDRGFLLADGVYEVIRSYRGILFEPGLHIERLDRSLEGLAITGVDTAGFIEIAERLISENGLSKADATVYMQVTRGAAARTHAFPGRPVSPTVYLSASKFESDQEGLSRGIGIILVPDNRWDRCDIKSIALLPNVLARQKAVEAGAQEAVFIRDGVVTEGGSSNFAAVFGGILVTHPEGGFILGSITRKVVLGLCAKIGVAVEERPIRKGELPYAGEMMIMSTTREITPVVECGGEKVADGKPGPVTRRIQEAFEDYKRNLARPLKGTGV